MAHAFIYHLLSDSNIWMSVINMLYMQKIYSIFCDEVLFMKRF